MGIPRWQVYRGYLRGMLLRTRGARVGQKASVGPLCYVERPAGLSVGKRSVIEPNVTLKIVSEKAKIVLGEYVFIGRNTTLDISRRLRVGDRALIAPGCFITDHNHNVARSSKIVDQGIEESEVEIGSDAWIGANVCVLPGVRIGEGAIVGAGAVVTRDVPDYCVAFGVPARVVRARE